MFVIALLCGYLAACFCLSACVIRAAKSTVSAQQVEERLWLFPALPLLLAIDAFFMLGELVERAGHTALAWFDDFSGRRRRRKIRKQYGYFSYGYVPPARKAIRTKPPRRSSRSQRRRMRA